MKYLAILFLLLEVILINAESFDYVSLTVPEESKFCDSSLQYTITYPFPVTRKQSAASITSTIFVSEGTYSLKYSENSVVMTIARSNKATSGVFTLLVDANTFFHESDSNNKFTTSFSYSCKPVVSVHAEMSGPSFSLYEDTFSSMRSSLVISGGQVVNTAFGSFDSIVSFSRSDIVPLSVSIVGNTYVIDLLFSEHVDSFEIVVKQSVFTGYWNKVSNEETTLTVETSSVTSNEPIAFWDTTFVFTNTNTGSIHFNTQQENCGLDTSSFYGLNVIIESVTYDEDSLTQGSVSFRISNINVPAELSFVAYIAKEGCVGSSPITKKLPIFYSTLPTYSLKSSSCGAGCANVEIQFTQPIQVLDFENVLKFIETSNGEISYQSGEEYLNSGYYFSLTYHVIGYETAEYSVILVDQAIKSFSGEYILPAETITINLIKEQVLLSFIADYPTYPIPKDDKVFDVHISTSSLIHFSLTPVNNFSLETCNFDTVLFDQEYDRVVYNNETNAWDITLSLSSLGIYILDINISDIKCTAFSNSFGIADNHYPSFAVAYDPAFLPGDILVTRVNSQSTSDPSKKNQEIDIIPMRIIYPWNVIYITDKSWIDDEHKFISDPNEGVLKLKSETIVFYAGEAITWKQSDEDNESIEKFFTLVDGKFFLTPSDNIFIYVTDNADYNSKFDSETITFLFGINWFAASWISSASTTTITAMNSRLPVQLVNNKMHISLGSTNLPYNRPYVSINTAAFTRSVLVPFVAQKMVTSYSYWLTSSITRYTPSSISVIANPVDYSIVTEETDTQISFTIEFYYPYSANYGKTNSLISIVDEATGVALTSMTIKKEGSGYIITATKPIDYYGRLVFTAQPKAFYYSTSFTNSDAVVSSYVYYSSIIIRTYEVRQVINNQVSYSINCYSTDSPSCLLTLSASTTCHWNTPHFVENSNFIIPLSATSNTAVYGMLLRNTKSVLVIPANTCEVSDVSDAVDVEIDLNATLYTPSNLYIRNGYSMNRFINDWNSYVTVKFTVPKALVYSYANVIVRSTEGIIPCEILPTVQQESILIKIKSKQALLSGLYTVTLLPGTYYNLFGYQTNGISTSFYYSDVPAPIEPYFSITSIYSVSVHNIILNMDDYALSYGSYLPNEAFECTGACTILGYTFDPDFPNHATISFVAGYGDFIIRVQPGKISNIYGNTNELFSINYAYDYTAPSALISLENTHFNTQPYTITITFNENVSFYNSQYAPVEPSEALSSILTSTHCLVRFGSEINLMTYTIELYECQRTTENILNINTESTYYVYDASINVVSLVNSIQTPLPMTLAYETEGTNVELVRQSEYILSQDFSVRATLSKKSLFNPSSLTIDNGIAFTATATSEDELTYSIAIHFVDAPTHLSFINVFFAENAFTDYAGNGNTASNILNYQVYTQGPSVSMTFGKTYTKETNEILTITISPLDKCSNYQTFKSNIIKYNTKTSNIGECTMNDSDGTNAIFTCPVTFRVSMNPNYADYQNMAYTIGSHFCESNIKSNDEATTFISFNVWRPVPQSTVEPAAPNHEFTITSVYTNCVAGSEEPSSYFVASLISSRRRLLENSCTVTRKVEENTVTYTATCSFDSGLVNYKFLEGAAIDFAGNEAAEYSGSVKVNGSKPISSLSFVDYSENTIIVGGKNVRVAFEIKFDKPVLNFSTSCLAYTTTSGTNSWVSFASKNIISSSNFLSGVFYVNNLVSTTDTISFYIKSSCVVDQYGNANEQSLNTLSTNFVFTQSIPKWTLCNNAEITDKENCDVLTTTTLTGTFTRPLMTLTSSNFHVDTQECTFEPTLAENGLSFSVNVLCPVPETVTISFVNIMDYLGNVNASPSEFAYVSYTVYGPVMSHILENEIIYEEQSFVNTRSFVFDISANNCSTMTIDSESISVSNANIVMSKKNQCTYTISGIALSDGTISVIVSEGVAENTQGGKSLSYAFNFIIRTRQPLPDLGDSIPTVFYGPSESNTIRIVFDSPIAINNEYSISAYGGCSSAIGAMESTDTLVISLITFAVEDDCFVTIPEGYIYAPWMIVASTIPLVIAVDSVNPSITFSIQDRSNMNVNKDFSLVCSSDENVTWNPREISVEGCDVTFVKSYPDMANKLILDYSILSTVNECTITVVVQSGFAHDIVDRLNDPSTFTINYKKEDLYYDILIPSRYVNTETIVLDFTFPSSASESLSINSFVFDKPGCTVEHIELNAENKGQVTLVFTQENDYTITIENTYDLYGNKVESQNAPYIITYDITPLFVSNPEQTVYISNYSDESSPKSVAVTVSFNKQVNLVGTFENSYILSSDASDAIEIDSHVFTMNTLTVTFNAKRTSDLHSVTFTLKTDAYVDNAGNQLSSTVLITIVVDNRYPTLTSSVHGHNLFLTLPVTITTEFSQVVSRVDTSSRLATHFIVRLNDGTLLTCAESSGNAFKITSYSMICSSDIELTSQTSITVVLPSGSVINEFGNKNEETTSTILKSTHPFIEVTSMIPPVDQTYTNINTITINTVNYLWSLDISKVICSGSVSCEGDYVINDNSIVFTYLPISQGAFTITFNTESLFSTDGATFETPLVISHTYDSSAPIVSYTTDKSNYKNEHVLLTATFNKAVMNLAQNSFDFKLTIEDVVSSPDSITVVETTPNTRIVFDILPRMTEADFYGILTVTINENNCKDIASNVCIAKRQTIVIDNMSPVATVQAANQYVGNSASTRSTVDLSVAFDEPVMGTLTADSLVLISTNGQCVVVPEPVESTTHDNTFVYTLDFSACAADIEYEVQYRLKNGVVTDYSGNKNVAVESDIIYYSGVQLTSSLIMNDAIVPPHTISFALTFNKNIEPLISSNLAIVPSSSVTIEGTNNEYVLTADLDCTGLCLVTVTLYSTIQSINGYALPEVSEQFSILLPPTITLSSTPAGNINTKVFDVSINSNENIKVINCVILLQEGLSFVEGTTTIYTNTDHAVCSFVSSYEVRDYNLVIPAHTLENENGIKNYDEVTLLVSINTVKPVVSLTSEWTFGDSTMNVLVNVVATKGTPIYIGYFSFYNCRVVNDSIEVIDEHTMNFRIDLLDTNLDFARVVFNAKKIHDDHNNWNDESEYVLRTDETKSTLHKLYYYPDNNDKIVLSFSKPVVSCGGKIQFVPNEEDKPAFEIDTNSDSIEILSSIVTVYPVLYSATAYTVSFTEDAFCDQSHNNAVYETCINCNIETPYSVPTPPTNVVFSAITSTSVTFTYSGIQYYKADEQLKMTYLHVYLNPAVPSSEIKFSTSETSGTFNITGLHPSTKYQFIFAVECAKGMGLPSEPYVFNTLFDTIAAPSEFIINQITYTNEEKTQYDAVLTWVLLESTSVVTYEVRNNDVVICETESNTCIVPNYVSLESKLFTLQAKTDAETSPIVEIQGPDNVVPRAPLPVNVLNVIRYNHMSTLITWNKAVTRYAPVSSYYVNYARVINIEQGIYQWTNITLSADDTQYEFKESDSKLRYVLVQANSLIDGAIVSSTATATTFYVGPVHVELTPSIGDTYVSLKIDSDMSSTGSCSLLSNDKVIKTETFSNNLMNRVGASSVLFTSLTPSTAYTIKCTAYDLSFFPSAQIPALSITTVDFVEPQLIQIVPDVYSYFILANIEASVPVKASCVAVEPINADMVTKASIISNGYSAFGYPYSNAVVNIKNLSPNTQYNVMCIITPLSTNYSRYTKLMQGRRLAEETDIKSVYVTTAPLYYPLITSVTLEEGFLNTSLTPTFYMKTLMPVIAYRGSFIVLRGDSIIQTISVTSSQVNVNDTMISLHITEPLTPDSKYSISISNAGSFLDKHSKTPSIDTFIQIQFRTTSDISEIRVPSILNVSPAVGETDSLSAGLYLTFENTVVLGNGKFTITLNDTSLVDNDINSMSSITLVDNVLIFKPEVVYPIYTNVVFTFGENSICSKGGFCMPETSFAYHTSSNSEQPALISVYPNVNEHVPASTNIILTFNKIMTISSNAVFVFVDEFNNQVNYVAQTELVLGNIVIDNNVITIKPVRLAPGHEYTLIVKPTDILDTEGNAVWPVINNLTFDFDEYECGGEYIAKYIDNNCECFTTETKCECWCGKELASNVVLRQLHMN